jgi:hypothetical protein
LKTWALAIAIAAASLFVAGEPLADNFKRNLVIVDQALETNPRQVPTEAVEACRPMRDMAVKLYKMKRFERAERRLEMCKKLLGVEDLR